MALKKNDKQFVSVGSSAVEKKLGVKKVERIPEEKVGGGINVAVKKEDIRGKVATLFIIGFFIILVGVIIVAGISEGDKIGNLKDLLVTVSGILAVPLGFVIGYYFRSQEEKD